MIDQCTGCGLEVDEWELFENGLCADCESDRLGVGYCQVDEPEYSEKDLIWKNPNYDPFAK